MYPDGDTLSHVARSGYFKAREKHGRKWRDRRREKHCQVLPGFFFVVNEHNNTNTNASNKKATIFKVIPEEKQQLVEEKDADNIRKVLCKSFIQRFWELNLCSYKYRVDCFNSVR